MFNILRILSFVNNFLGFMDADKRPGCKKLILFIFCIKITAWQGLLLWIFEWKRRF